MDVIRSMLIAAAIATPATAAPVAARSADRAVAPAVMTAFRACLAKATDEPGAIACEVPVHEACERGHDQPGTTIGITECALAVAEAWDRVLNERWRRIVATQTPATVAKLRVAQRHWIALRDADCAAIYEAHVEGTIRNPLAAACRVEHTRARHFYLARFDP
jgi:uncharacterized protein YecT (DUF1311 family)